MAYKNFIPEAPDDMGATSYQEIQDNFAAISTWVEIDHFGFDVEKSGKHQKVTFLKKANAPETGADEVALYAKDLGDILSLFVRGEKNANERLVSEVEDSSEFANSGNWLRLSCGLLLKWFYYDLPKVSKNKVQISIPAISGSPEFKEAFFPIVLYNANPNVSTGVGSINYFLNFTKNGFTYVTGGGGFRVLILVLGV